MATEEETLKNMEMEMIHDECVIDLSKQLELPPAAISYGTHEFVNKKGSRIIPTPIATYGNFSFVQAPPKSHKTYFISLLSSVYMSNNANNYHGNLKHHRGDRHIIHFDTEQGDWHSQNVFKRPLEMNDYSKCDYYHTFALRPISYKKRMEFIEYYISKLSEDGKKVGLVIIDGVADLVSDSNDLKESSLCVQKIMEITARYDCHIVTVIHTNYGTNKATGHLGSFLSKKAETCINLERNPVNKTYIDVKCHFSRGIPFDTFSFELSKYSYPKVIDFDIEILNDIGHKTQYS